ncbi:fungal-specific transcription factor [Leptodontidium sp. MPI-SDFR-AT-0119]|nr:fungal-specific transcription factor [Leptodontidium sp. MPI-SDFR-AT-0119]
MMADKRPLSSPSEDPSSPPAAKRPRKKVACQRCHAQKIKCSGERPCAKCAQAGFGNDCQYQARDRKITVSQSYIDQLLAENERLRDRPPSPARDAPPEIEHTSRRDHTDPDQSRRNPIIGDQAWFQRYDPIAPPIYVGEAACTAFATRLRRFLTGNTVAAHISRTEYMSEAALSELSTVDVPWPSFTHATLLLKVAFHQAGRVYHMMCRKSTFEALKDTYETRNFDAPVNKCKFFTLFALGEVYSIRSNSSTGQVPGVNYYAKSLALIQILPERPTITHIENLLLLSLFSYSLNRRHHAFLLIGSAMRHALVIGMNHNIGASQVVDPVEREHRVRIWWTIYIFDRMWGSKMGIPNSILDEDVHLDMPTTISPKELHDEQFPDTDYATASVNLARIAGEVITKTYSRKKYKETFLQRVQQLLKSLKAWVETLPEHLRLNSEESGLINPKYIVSLHLSFNQIVILTTRPMLLRVLTQMSNHVPDRQGSKDGVSQAALTLAEACIHAAKHSHSLIIHQWTSGSLPIFGYFNVQYLFSSAMVLLMSSLIATESATSDMEAFETAAQILRCMSGDGNLTAAEFSKNLEEVKRSFEIYKARRNPDHSSGDASGAGVVDSALSLTAENGDISTAFGSGMNASMRNAPGGFTTEMAFLEPTMQNFLAQSDFDLGLLNPSEMSGDASSALYFWNTPQWTE